MEKLLIIDDSQFDIAVLTGILQQDYEIFSAKDGDSGIQAALSVHPRLIMLDVVMPGKDGFEVLEQLKKDDITNIIPVILLTGLSDIETEEKGLLSGAIDYIRKPYNANIVKARVMNHMRLSQYRETIENQLAIDTLTGIYNRRYFNSHSKMIWRQAVSQQKPFSFLMVDIDFFKMVNDTYGHPQGDAVLKQVATCIKASFPTNQQGFVFRYGGEEFGIVYYNCYEEDAQYLANKLRQSIVELNIPNQNSQVAQIVTASIGGATVIPDKSFTLQELVSLADTALYDAKRSGRNKVVWKNENEM